jgi:hypothetical protein
VVPELIKGCHLGPQTLKIDWVYKLVNWHTAGPYPPCVYSLLTCHTNVASSFAFNPFSSLLSQQLPTHAGTRSACSLYQCWCVATSPAICCAATRPPSWPLRLAGHRWDGPLALVVLRRKRWSVVRPYVEWGSRWPAHQCLGDERVQQRVKKRERVTLPWVSVTC